MFRLRRLPIFLGLILCFSLTVTMTLAQDCPAIVRQALQTADNNCSALGRNEACYGNVNLLAEAQPDVTDFLFSQPGDRVNINQVRSLVLSSMNTVTQQWGVAVLKIQANLPDTLPGQNVSLLLIGDVEMVGVSPNANNTVSISVTAKQDANVRQQPSRESAVVSGLAVNTTLVANGRTADSSWLHVKFADETVGWVFATLLSTSEDANTLPVLDAAQPTSTSGSMQAFFFRSGLNTSACDEAPNGLLIQSPPGGPRVALNINGAKLDIGSTVFIQAPSNGSQMTVSTLAGSVIVSSKGMAATVPQGAQTSLQLDSNSAVSSAPSQPVPIVESLLSPLVSEVNQTKLIVPTYEDAAAHPKTSTSQTLTADNPVQAASASELGSPQPTGSVDLDDIFVPLPPCRICIHLPNGEILVIGTANPPTEELYEYPTSVMTPTRVPTRVPTRQPEEGSFESIPDERLDLFNGIWSHGPNTVTRSSGCESYGGDNDGYGGVYRPDDPALQSKVCFSFLYGILSLDSEIYRWYGNGTPNTYQTDTRVDGYDNSTSQKIITVINEGSFDVTQITKAGACTITSTTHYDIYVPGMAFGCNVNSKVWTVGGEPVDVETGKEPTEQPEPEDVIIDPIVAGEYKVSWLPFDPQFCAPQYAPTFDTLTVSPTSFSGVNLTVDGQSYSFSGDGMRGRFSLYGQNVTGELERRLTNDFRLNWQATSPDKQKSCGAQGVLTLVQPAAQQPVFNPPPIVLNNESTTGDLEPISTPAPQTLSQAGDYSVEWSPMPMLECPEALKQMLPNFTQASLSANDTTLTLNGGSTQYDLDVAPNGWAFIDFKPDNSGISLNLTTEGGQVTGSYTYFSSDGKMCIMKLNFNQLP